MKPEIVNITDLEHGDIVYLDEHNQYCEVIKINYTHRNIVIEFEHCFRYILPVRFEKIYTQKKKFELFN